MLLDRGRERLAEPLDRCGTTQVDKTHDGRLRTARSARQQEVPVSTLLFPAVAVVVPCEPVARLSVVPEPMAVQEEQVEKE